MRKGSLTVLRKGQGKGTFKNKNCNKKWMLGFVTRSISQKPYFSDEKKSFIPKMAVNFELDLNVHNKKFPRDSLNHSTTKFLYCSWSFLL